MLRKTVVHEKRRTGLQTLPQTVHKSLRLQMDFTQIIMVTLNGARRSEVGGLVMPDIALRAFVPSHTSLMPHAIDTVKQLDGHGIQHLVANDHCVDLLGQLIQPLHFVCVGFEIVGLLLPQMRRHLNDVITRDAATQAFKQLQSQAAVARAKFHHFLKFAVLQGLIHTARQGFAEIRRHQRGCDEIAAAGRHAAQRLTAGTVITGAWRIQCQCHEPVKRQPACLRL